MAIGDIWTAEEGATLDGDCDGDVERPTAAISAETSLKAMPAKLWCSDRWQTLNSHAKDNTRSYLKFFLIRNSNQDEERTLYHKYRPSIFGIRDLYHFVSDGPLCRQRRP